MSPTRIRPYLRPGDTPKVYRTGRRQRPSHPAERPQELHMVPPKFDWLARWMRATFRDELAGRPCYMLAAEQIPAEFRPTNPFWAFTAGTLSERLAEVLQSLQIWQGPGFVCVFSPDAERLSQRQQIHLAIHELGHYLECEFLRSSLRIDPQEILQALAVPVSKWSQIENQQIATRWKQVGGFPPWLVAGDHGSRFIRVALHMGHRANLKGFTFDPDRATIAGERYGLSHPAVYEQALQAELWKHRCDPIGEILALPEPPEFRRVFLADALRWSRTCSDVGTTPPFGAQKPP